MPQNDLIFDVGMHRGKDTEFYIAKGFRVVAVEANPALVKQVQQRLGATLEDKLRIYNVAVADHSGTTKFWINDLYDDWGTISAEFAQRNASLGVTSREVTVPCRKFEEILDECGTPYYLKIDIEGADLLCLEALQSRERPKYVSIEADLGSFDGCFEQISTLWSLGYRHFKMVNQGRNEFVRCPRPPREGSYVDMRFDGKSTGPFGEEAPGKWISAVEILSYAATLILEQEKFGLTGRYSKRVWGRVYRRFKRLRGEPIAWFDIHARLGSDVTTR